MSVSKKKKVGGLVFFIFAILAVLGAVSVFKSIVRDFNFDEMDLDQADDDFPLGTF